MVRESNETLISYIRRILANDELDKGQQYEIIFNDKVAYDTARKQLRGVQNFLDLLETEELNNISDESIKNRFENEKQIIKKERIKLSTEKSILNQRLCEEAKQELLQERIIEEFKNIKINVPTHKIEVPQKENLALNLVISDEHVGNEFTIKDLSGNIMNHYDKKVFEDRMWQIFNKLLPYQKDFKKLKILDLGDSIEGILRMSSLQGLKYGAVESATYFGMFMAQWLTELSNIFHVEIGEADGNHSETRPLGSKKGEFKNENLAITIRAIIETAIKFKNNPNLVLLPCTSTGSIYTKSAGFDILAIHGQDEKNKLEEIYRDYNSFYPNNIDYIFIGHLHYNESVNKNVIRVPSIVGTNVFSEKLKKRSDAGAEILIFEKEVGLVEQHHIHLN
jgi:hypothetical protein